MRVGAKLQETNEKNKSEIKKIPHTHHNRMRDTFCLIGSSNYMPNSIFNRAMKFLVSLS